MSTHATPMLQSLPIYRLEESCMSFHPFSHPSAVREYETCKTCNYPIEEVPLPLRGGARDTSWAV